MLSFILPYFYIMYMQSYQSFRFLFKKELAYMHALNEFFLCTIR